MPKYKSKFDIKYDAIKTRFPDAQFSICCFKTIEEIETKVLCADDVIIVSDNYQYKYKDVFIIKKREDEEFIYYKDVIDELIKNNYVRNKCDHKFLEEIGKTQDIKYNINSVELYGFSWGS